MTSSMEAEDYPELSGPNDTAKGWDVAPLHECTIERMLIIGRDTYGLSNLSRRFTITCSKNDECGMCGSTFNPMSHIHEAIMEKPPHKSGEAVRVLPIFRRVVRLGSIAQELMILVRR